MKKITTKAQLKRKLNIKNLGELEKPEVIKRFETIAKFVTPELFTEVVRAAPKIAKAFTDYLKELNEYGKEVEVSKQERWQCLREAIKTGQMTGEQILEGMRLLGEMDSRDSEGFKEHREENHKSVRDTKEILKKGMKAVGAVLLIAAGFVAKNMLDKGDDSSKA